MPTYERRWLWASVVAGLLEAKPQPAPQRPSLVQERLLNGTSIELVRREIRISGRVTRAGAPAPGLGVNVAKSEFSCSLGLSPGIHIGPAAKTHEDGRFELIVNEPGDYFVCVGSLGTLLPMREIEIPDTEFYFVDLAYEEIAVAGVVVDQASGEPIADARVEASPKDGQGPDWSAETVAGPDGRFQLRAFAEGEC